MAPAIPTLAMTMEGLFQVKENSMNPNPVESEGLGYHSTTLLVNPQAPTLSLKLHLMSPAENRVSFYCTLFIFFLPEILFSDWNCLAKLLCS
jgi:hypothetical protein